MKQQGDDTQFEIYLGKVFTFREISLTHATIENLFSNMYKSLREDFSDLSFEIEGLPVFNIVADQYLTGASEVVQFLNEYYFGPHSWELSIVDQGKPWLPSIQIENIGAERWRPIGSGWNKLGFDLPAVFQKSHQGQRQCDLSQTPSIMISLDNISPLVSNGLGSGHFVIANNAGFGSKINYHNDQQKQSQTLYLQQPISIDRLFVRLLNCDQAPLQTVRANQPRQNMLNPECVFVFQTK